MCSPELQGLKPLAVLPRKGADCQVHGANEALEEFGDVLLNGELVGGGEVAYNEIEETV